MRLVSNLVGLDTELTIDGHEPIHNNNITSTPNQNLLTPIKNGATKITITSQKTVRILVTVQMSKNEHK